MDKKKVESSLGTSWADSALTNDLGSKKTEKQMEEKYSGPRNTVHLGYYNDEYCDKSLIVTNLACNNRIQEHN